ncbi:hypothetical protein RGQ15_21455 [Paracoccus sp. MBLB3053]|uniref:Uncharacterized protein n=1 Tax=Paracoccus aurantius TaxID=3073814 RepID=A0ABU2HYJ1_9RHOB|nr:hypothetical protein [Paracoccus sp. MBLB3053]MDS9470123.1 hypothetical protein [Paracoccus sp. MBLB3053]
MSVSKVIEEQKRIFEEAGKRFGSDVRETSVRVDAAAEMIKRVEIRIERLNAEKKAVLARYDEAIAAEEAALKQIAAIRPNPPREAVGKDTADRLGKLGATLKAADAPSVKTRSKPATRGAAKTTKKTNPKNR